jgi:hypothetical protein
MASPMPAPSRPPRIRDERVFYQSLADRQPARVTASVLIAKNGQVAVRLTDERSIVVYRPTKLTAEKLAQALMCAANLPREAR